MSYCCKSCGISKIYDGQLHLKIILFFNDTEKRAPSPYIYACRYNYPSKAFFIKSRLINYSTFPKFDQLSRNALYISLSCIVYVSQIYL